MTIYIRRLFLSCCAVSLLCLPVASGQSRQSTAPGASAPDLPVLLSVTGEVEHPLRLKAADLAKLPRQTVQAKDHDGRNTTFEGIAIGEILKLAGAPAGEKLRGKGLSLYLLVEAADGYRVVFALPELDPAFTDQTIILADRRDGKQLSQQEGPLRIVVPGEKRQGRWVRQVVTLSIRRS